MTATAALLVAGVSAAMIDWWAVGTDRRRLELVAKPVTMAMLVAVAAVAGDAPGDVRLWLVIGAALGLVGDGVLLFEGETAFVIGLGSFAAGHLAYAVAAILLGVELAWVLPGLAFVAVLLGFRFVTRILPGARSHGGPVLAGAVAFYAFVISAMVVTSWATGAWLAAAGGMLFAVSDWVLGYRRFVGPLRVGRLGVMVPYHVGQALLILGLATG